MTEGGEADEVDLGADGGDNMQGELGEAAQVGDDLRAGPRSSRICLEQVFLHACWRNMQSILKNISN